MAASSSVSRASISVQSEPGRGTTFRLLFPAVQAGRAEYAGEIAGIPSFGYETILLTEDEAGVRGYVRHILERQGYRVAEASNGLEAMDVIHSFPEPIHLLLTDVVMPEVGGVELAAQFASVYPGVPILYMSGLVTNSGRRILLALSSRNRLRLRLCWRESANLWMPARKRWRGRRKCSCNENCVNIETGSTCRASNRKFRRDSPRAYSNSGYPPRKRWTRSDRARRLSPPGLWERERLELIEGDLISRMGKNWLHVHVIAHS